MHLLADLELGNSLVLRQVKNEQDAELFIRCNQVVTREGPICDRLIHFRPDTPREDFFFVLDTRTGEAVSTTCLLPWQVNFKGVILKVAMLEMVVTHPDYRRQGLIRSQIQLFQRLVNEECYDLSIIQGIPNYYRQYGYAYALDHTHSITVSARLISDSPSKSQYELCEPTAADFAQMTSLYHNGMSNQDVYVERNQDYWEYLFQHLGRPITLVKTMGDHTLVGYLCCRLQECLWDIQENAISSPIFIPTIMAKCKEDSMSEVQIVGNQADPLYRWAESLGGVTQTPDQWLINIPDPRNFLLRLGPVFEDRLKSAGFQQYNGHITINFYRYALKLIFRDAILIDVENVGFIDASMSAVEHTDLRIPIEAFVRLVFGYRTMDKLRDAWPDVAPLPASKFLLEILFPKLSSLILMPY